MTDSSLVLLPRQIVTGLQSSHVSRPGDVPSVPQDGRNAAVGALPLALLAPLVATGVLTEHCVN